MLRFGYPFAREGLLWNATHGDLLDRWILLCLLVIVDRCEAGQREAADRQAFAWICFDRAEARYS